MSIRALVRHIKWTIVPDREPDAEPVTHQFQCVVCSEKSDRSTSWSEPQDWALAHSGQHPSHHTYRESITRPWRTFMTDTPGPSS
ncbi:hypothetical protein [Streptomyces californicus]|uniref:DUF7848 domain-containing protein n=1 Tax=Streptomyces californicus TaxID=67351 RepID=UPI0034080BEF